MKLEKEPLKKANYYGIDEIDESQRDEKLPVNNSLKLVSASGSNMERLPLESFKTTLTTTRTNSKERAPSQSSSLTNNSSSNMMSMNEEESSSNALQRHFMSDDDDLRPVFYELDELEKRLSESLCELAKMKSRDQLAHLAALNAGLDENYSIDDLTASLIGSSDPSQDLYGSERDRLSKN